MSDLKIYYTFFTNLQIEYDELKILLIILKFW